MAVVDSGVSYRNPHAHAFRPEVIDRILTALRAGNSLAVSAAAAGVARSTVHRWLARADSPDAPLDLVAFRDACTQARAEGEMRLVAAAMRAAAGGTVTRRITRYRPDGTVQAVVEHLARPDGRVALELLARMYPQRWARRQATPAAGPGDDVAPPVLSPNRLHALAERVRQAHAQEGGGSLHPGTAAG